MFVESNNIIRQFIVFFEIHIFVEVIAFLGISLRLIPSNFRSDIFLNWLLARSLTVFTLVLTRWLLCINGWCGFSYLDGWLHLRLILHLLIICISTEDHFLTRYKWVHVWLRVLILLEITLTSGLPFEKSVSWGHLIIELVRMCEWFTVGVLILVDVVTCHTEHGVVPLCRERISAALIVWIHFTIYYYYKILVD